MIDESGRHLTLAFLGNISFSSIQKALSSFPQPSFRIGLTGIADRPLFLPEKNPRVVGWHIEWLTYQSELELFYHHLIDWLATLNFPLKNREFLSHVTVARLPFKLEEWVRVQDTFPVVMQAIHLYESVGNLRYKPIWSYPLLSPFTELDHTADIAFLIQGENLAQIYLHAQMALAFKFPPLLPYLDYKELNSLDEVIIHLNEIVGRADAACGTPFKAVSFHGELYRATEVLQWEMIVDV